MCLTIGYKYPTAVLLRPEVQIEYGGLLCTANRKPRIAFGEKGTQTPPFWNDVPYLAGQISAKSKPVTVKMGSQ
jgi:hypothetical protein